MKRKEAYIEGAGIIEEQKITRTLEENYMPYAMSVILSRAIPEIDGFKPSHRKLLYTMYKMGLLNGRLTKSANIVGQTMRLNPHGDATIYETMVRLSRGYQALLHPYVESKGNFGRAYSRDMMYAASRYTEAKLDPICNELFRDIGKNTVDFIPNYDNTTTEPVLLPTSFPAVLVNANMGIAVSMASSICPFNLEEICRTTIGLLQKKSFDINETLKGPDFPGGGFLMQNEEELQKIYETGKGSVKIRCRYQYDKENHCIDITEIPPSTTVEAIMDKIVELIKQNKLREISDMRDETDLHGLKLTLDLRRGVDPQKLMRRLFKMTPLEDSFSCNFNLLIKGSPKVLGVREILLEWIDFRMACVSRRLRFDQKQKQEKLHLLEGLQKILLDIDKAIRIIRETEEENEVVANLMIGFGIDEIQADFVAEIKLRHLNREYILKRTEEIQHLKEEIETLTAILEDEKKLKRVLIKELQEVIKKYGKKRKTLLLFPEMEEEEPEEELPSYPVHLFVTEHGYLKKITPQSLRMSSQQKTKEDDRISLHIETKSNADLLVFTDKQQVYKTNLSHFPDAKASILGEYLPAVLGMEEGEDFLQAVVTENYSETLLLFFANGKVAKIPLSAYQTKTNRKKLTGAYSDKSPVIAVFVEREPQSYLMKSTSGKMLLFSSAKIQLKKARNTQGVFVMSQMKNHSLQEALLYREGMLAHPYRYQTKTLPARGANPQEGDLSQQLRLT